MHSWINSYLNLNPVRSVKRRVLAISMTTTAEISSTFAMVTWSRITSASCVYSVTTASMHMLFCQTLSFLIPAMACSSFFASLLSSSPIFIQLNRSVNDIIYLKTSSANGSLFGSCIKSNGLGF